MLADTTGQAKQWLYFGVKHTSGIEADVSDDVQRADTAVHRNSDDTETEKLKLKLRIT